MDEEQIAPESLKPVLRPYLRRLAAAAGSVVALLSLCGHAPVWVCCARGGASLLGLMLVGELGLEALRRAARAEQDTAVAQQPSRSERT